MSSSLYINLYEERCNPDADEEQVAVEAVEDVSLFVNLACVDLIEQRHHDERVEDDREVLSRTLRLLRHRVSTAVDVEQMLTWTHTSHSS